jgi:hypothetical protein
MGDHCTITVEAIIGLFVKVFADIGVSIWRGRLDHDGLQKDGLSQQARQ